MFTEQANLDAFMKAVGVPWGIRTMASTVNYDIGKSKHIIEHTSVDVMKATSTGRRVSTMEVALGAGPVTSKDAKGKEGTMESVWKLMADSELHASLNSNSKKKEAIM